MENIYEEISRFAKREKEETEKAVQTEESQVCIKADSYIAKEIKYQTALLHQILNRLDEICLLKEKKNSRKIRMEQGIIITAAGLTETERKSIVKAVRKIQYGRKKDGRQSLQYVMKLK